MEIYTSKIQALAIVVLLSMVTTMQINCNDKVVSTQKRTRKIKSVFFVWHDIQDDWERRHPFGPYIDAFSHPPRKMSRYDQLTLAFKIARPVNPIKLMCEKLRTSK
jgi:hypothetical protein